MYDSPARLWAIARSQPSFMRDACAIACLARSTAASYLPSSEAFVEAVSSSWKCMRSGEYCCPGAGACANAPASIRAIRSALIDRKSYHAAPGWRFLFRRPEPCSLSRRMRTPDRADILDKNAARRARRRRTRGRVPEALWRGPGAVPGGAFPPALRAGGALVLPLHERSGRGGRPRPGRVLEGSPELRLVPRASEVFDVAVQHRAARRDQPHAAQGAGHGR